MDIAGYVQNNSQQILDAGKEAYQKLGRGALVSFPQQDNGKGRSDVKYHPLEWLQDDNDPARPIVETYNPETEAVLILCLDHPKAIYTYVVMETGGIDVSPVALLRPDTSDW